MSDITEALYGKDYSDRDDKFHALIDELDEKYPDVLPEGRTFGEFFVSTYNVVGPGRITFAIKDDDNLVPQHIRDEMTNIFTACWGPGS